MSQSRRRDRFAQSAAGASGRLGGPLILLLVWMGYEFGRPDARLIFKVPLLISLVSFGLWIQRKDKQLGKTGPYWFALLASMLIMIPFALNNFAAYNFTRTQMIAVLTIYLPLQSLLRSVKDVRAWVYAFIAISTYVGIWATMTGGYARGGQDENYAAAIMCMALPFSYFAFTYDTRKIRRLLYMASIVIFVAAMALANNASRGGFLALCCVGAYIIVRSPRKHIALGLLGLASVALLLIAGPSFWAEIQTTSDFETGTGDLRLRAWKGGMRMFLAYPIFGVGPGNFGWQLGNFETAAEVATLGRSMGGAMVAHSMWVEGLSEVGLIGMGSMLALCWFAWTNLEKVQKQAGRLSKIHPGVHDFVELRGMAFALQGSMLAVGVNGLFLSLFYYPHMWLLIVVANALPYVLADLMRRHPQGQVLGGRQPRNVPRPGSRPATRPASQPHRHGPVRRR